MPSSECNTLPACLQIGEIHTILDAAAIDYRDCFERQELLARLRSAEGSLPPHVQVRLAHAQNKQDKVNACISPEGEHWYISPSLSAACPQAFLLNCQLGMYMLNSCTVHAYQGLQSNVVLNAEPAAVHATAPGAAKH